MLVTSLDSTIFVRKVFSRPQPYASLHAGQAWDGWERENEKYECWSCDLSNVRPQSIGGRDHAGKRLCCLRLYEMFISFLMRSNKGYILSGLNN